MSSLSDHETAVLMIAEKGESMIPIGIWEKPILNLTMLGLLKKLDSVNYIITDAGRAMLDKRQQVEDEQFVQAFAKVTDARNAQQQVIQSVEDAASHLVLAAKASVKLTEHTPQQEVWTLGQQVVARAIELMK